MADPFCRICGAPASDGSTLCERHRAQALSFSSSFAPAPQRTGGAAKSAPEGKPTPGGASPSPGSAGAPLSAASTGPTSAPAPVADPLAFNIQRAMKAIVAWQKQRTAGDLRWPQLALYVLRGEIVANDYYGVTASAGNAAPLNLEAPPLAEAIAPGGLIYERLTRAFAERQSALERGELQMLTVEFRWQDRLVRLCERRHAQPHKPIAVFQIDGTTLNETPA